MTAGCLQCIEKSEPKKSPPEWSFDYGDPGFKEMLHEMRLKNAQEEALMTRPTTAPEIPAIVIKPDLDNTDSDEISPRPPVIPPIVIKPELDSTDSDEISAVF